MALTDILLPAGDAGLELEFPDGSLNTPTDILSDIFTVFECSFVDSSIDFFTDEYKIIELPYVSASTGVDIITELKTSGMLSEILHDPIQIFVDVDGRIAIRLDKNLIKILD